MVKLDRFDIAILQVLAREGRITKSRLAELIHLSVSPTWERVQRLEAAGVIRGYRADVDWSGVVQVSRIIVEITLARHTAHDMNRFEAHLREAPEVVQCHATGGGVDYIVHVLARDIDHYQRFIDDLLMADFGIERYFTYIVTKVVKDNGNAIPGWVDPD